jgi:signal transduction histidine kinase
VAIVLSGPSIASPGFAAAARALMVGVPVAIGLYAWRRRPEERFGRLLVAAGLGWFLTSLGESGDAIPYSIGRVSGWLVELGLVYLALSFPAGRLRERVDRALVDAAALLVATLYLPTALLVQHYPVPSPWDSCGSACPDNAFFVLHSQPAWVDSAVRPTREVLTVLLFLAVSARLASRIRSATPLMRRTLSPVLLVAIAFTLVLAAALAARAAASYSLLAEVLAWAIALSLPAIAVAFLVGLLRWRLFIADALPKLGTRMRPNMRPRELRDALRVALDDPSLRLFYPVPVGGGSWVDVEGQPVELPWNGRFIAEVRDGNRRIAAIAVDEALRDQRELVDSAAAYATIALENHQLSAKVDSSLREIAASRARISAAADRERQRIERDLHDGAQQHLVALRIKLQLAEELLERDPARGLPKLHALGSEIEETLEDIRSLAHGVYPALLAESGIGEALRAVALRTPVATSVDEDGIGRYSREVESAVYFCCLEAVQNAGKHAGGVTSIAISLSDTDGLRFEVRDDGAGFDLEASGEGTGLTNMRDRLGAVGGELAIRSAPGRGVVVVGTVPTGAR